LLSGVSDTQHGAACPVTGTASLNAAKELAPLKAYELTVPPAASDTTNVVDIDPVPNRPPNGPVPTVVELIDAPSVPSALTGNARSMLAGYTGFSVR
jgi:hypothetical protein